MTRAQEAINTVHELPAQESAWIRDEAIDLLRRSHETMMRVILAQAVALGAIAVRFPDASSCLLAGLLTTVLSLGGLYYSRAQLRHSRFLHSLLRQAPPGSPFLRYMVELRDMKARVKPRFWEETTCSIGYSIAPIALAGVLPISPGLHAEYPWILALFCGLIATVIVNVVAWVFRGAHYAADAEAWRLYFARQSITPTEP